MNHLINKIHYASDWNVEERADKYIYENYDKTKGTANSLYVSNKQTKPYNSDNATLQALKLSGYIPMNAHYNEKSTFPTNARLTEYIKDHKTSGVASIRNNYNTGYLPTAITSNFKY
jgi:hypothetical protein